MKTDIETLKDLFKWGYDSYYDSRVKADMIENMYHNRQFTPDQLNTLAERGQPPETFNIIKLFSRQLLGYYSAVINTVKITPINMSDINVANLLNDVVSYVDRTNNFASEGDKIKLDGFLAGLMCSYKNVVPQKDVNGVIKKDEAGQIIYKITKEHVPASEIVLDPLSSKTDYSDGRFIHRFKWMPEERIKSLFPGKLKELEAYNNHLDVEEAEYEYRHTGEFDGVYHRFNNYLVVHTYILDDDDVIWSIYWSNDTILHEQKLDYEDAEFAYRAVRLQDSNYDEYYGIFEDVYQSQNAINQAIIQIQLMSNSNKVLVQDGAVEDNEEFADAFRRVNAVIPVNDINGVKVENMSGEIQQQYLIVDKSLERIQRVLGINDSFLGMAYASDSGRKVKLQQNATVMALRYINNKLELFYKLDGWDTVKLIKKYFRAEQVLRIADEEVGERWIAVNQNLRRPDTGEIIYDEALDENGEPKVDKETGAILVEPVADADTLLDIGEVDIEINSVAYDDEDEKNQIFVETVMNGPIGNMLMTVNPAGFAKMAAMSIKGNKTRFSMEIAGILEQTAEMLAPQPEQQQALGSGGGGAQGQPNAPKSTDSLAQGGQR